MEFVKTFLQLTAIMGVQIDINEIYKGHFCRVTIESLSCASFVIMVLCVDIKGGTCSYSRICPATQFVLKKSLRQSSIE